jgi:hypothetical protein
MQLGSNMGKACNGRICLHILVAWDTMAGLTLSVLGLATMVWQLKQAGGVELLMTRGFACDAHRRGWSSNMSMTHTTFFLTA